MNPWKSMAASAVLLLLAACGAQEATDPQRPGADASKPADTSASVSPRESVATVPAGRPTPDGGPGVAFTPIDALPPTRTLEVTVEGQREAREARLFRSPQGYAIYVLPQLAMTPEEPCCDLAYARVDDGFFMRIERIDEAMDLATLRADMQLALSSVGPADEADGHAYVAAQPGTAVELALRAMGDGVSLVMLVARIDGGRYRVTLHLPHREALEGIAPSFRAMLGSLRTTGPRDVG